MLFIFTLVKIVNKKPVFLFTQVFIRTTTHHFFGALTPKRVDTAFGLFYVIYIKSEGECPKERWRKKNLTVENVSDISYFLISWLVGLITFTAFLNGHRPQHKKPIERPSCQGKCWILIIAVTRCRFPLQSYGVLACFVFCNALFKA